MDLRVFKNEPGSPLLQIGVIDELTSLIWTDKYFGVGSVQLQAPMTPNNINLIKCGNFLIMHDGEPAAYIGPAEGIMYDFEYRRGMVLTYVHYIRDAEGQELIEASGSSLSSILNQRLVVDVSHVHSGDRISEHIYNLVKYNIGFGTDNSRAYSPQIDFINTSPLGGTSNYAPEPLRPLGDAVRDLCIAAKIGYDLLACDDLQHRILALWLYEGQDLTVSNTDGNDPVVFSIDFDNVLEQEFEDDISNIATVAYVQGAEDSEGVREVVTVNPSPSPRREHRYELFVDGSDIPRQENDVDIPVATYRQYLTTKGLQALAQAVENLTFNSAINLNSNLQYNVDFKLGDRVTCQDARWGVTINARITALTHTYEGGYVRLEATFGESAPTLLEKIKKVR
jgi:hypothetical protein